MLHERHRLDDPLAQKLLHYPERLQKTNLDIASRQLHRSVGAYIAENPHRMHTAFDGCWNRSSLAQLVDHVGRVWLPLPFPLWKPILEQSGDQFDQHSPCRSRRRLSVDFADAKRILQHASRS